MSETFVVREDALNWMLRSSHGPVALYSHTLARRVANRAKANASAAGPRPWGRIKDHPPGPYMRSGDLVNKLDVYGPFSSPAGTEWLVGSNATHQGENYPATVERGGYVYNRRLGKLVRFPAYPYLEPALPPDFVRAG